MIIIDTYHPQLLKYKDLHKGETCYIFGSGPSFNQFKLQEEGVFIGCNHIIKNLYIKNNLKYYFFGHGYTEYTTDNSPFGNHKQDVDTTGNHVEKFCMVSRDNDFDVHKFTSESIKQLENINALPCDININTLYKDLEHHPFLNHSIVFPATQFALYAGFKKIYLVGCDCTGYFGTNGYLSNIQYGTLDRDLISWWEKLYQHKNNNYPTAQLISINPVGLKGVMDFDIYS